MMAAASTSAKCFTARAQKSLVCAAGRPGALAHGSVGSLFFGGDEPGCTTSLKAVHAGSSSSALRQQQHHPHIARWAVRGVRAQAAPASATTAEPTKLKTGSWQWKYGEETLKIYYEEHVKSGGGGGGGAGPVRDLLFLPSIADVSYTGEWSPVARLLVGADGGSWRAVVVDWPGLGYSDRPALDYSYQIMEQFLKDFVTAPDGPLASCAAEGPIIIGCGHGASLAVKAVSTGVIKARAIAAVAPTWAGPLPIVFGRDDTMEGRYGVLRGTLRAPGLGWAAYKYLVGSPSNVRTQYLTHVYADADNVTPDVVDKGIELTQRDGARFVSAAFLTGKLDPARSRDEFVALFAGLEAAGVPALVVATSKSPRRSRAEMEALRDVKGVARFVEVPGALLPQEEFPGEVTSEINKFLAELPL